MCPLCKNSKLCTYDFFFFLVYLIVLWRKSDPRDLVIPLDVHVYTQAEALGLCKRRSKDFATAMEITDSFRELFPDDPVKGDFALFGYGVNSGR